MIYFALYYNTNRRQFEAKISVQSLFWGLLIIATTYCVLHRGLHKLWGKVEVQRYREVLRVAHHWDSARGFYERIKLDQSRIDKIDAIVKWVKTFASVTTFEQWYNFYSIAR